MLRSNKSACAPHLIFILFEKINYAGLGKLLEINQSINRWEVQQIGHPFLYVKSGHVASDKTFQGHCVKVNILWERNSFGALNRRCKIQEFSHNNNNSTEAVACDPIWFRNHLVSKCHQPLISIALHEKDAILLGSLCCCLQIHHHHASCFMVSTTHYRNNSFNAIFDVVPPCAHHHYSLCFEDKARRFSANDALLMGETPRYPIVPGDGGGKR